MERNLNNSNNVNNNNIRQQLFLLNALTIDELRLKWFELTRTNPNNFKKGFLIKGLAYKIQTLAGASEVSEEELKATLKVTKDKLKKINNQNITFDKNNKVKAVIILPPAGSIIKKIHKGKEYMVKVIAEDKFEYNGESFKSLSAIATKISGTRWSGYAFFDLKKKVERN